MVAEAIEQPSARVPGGGRAILALIEEQPGLLALPQIDVVLDAAFGDGDRFGDIARQHLHALLESLEDSCARIVARQNAARVQHLAQCAGNRRQQTIGSLGQRLHHQIVAVAIDDERGKQIGFAMDQTVRRRVDGERLPESNRRFDAPPDQGGVRRLLSGRQHPQRDLRRAAVHGMSQRTAARIADQHDLAAFRANVCYIGAIDPRVAGRDAVRAARGNNYSRVHSSRFTVHGSWFTVHGSRFTV